MKFVHGHKLEFHATMNMNQTRSFRPCDKWFKRSKWPKKLPNEMKLQLHAEKFCHGTNLNFHVESSFGKHELYFPAFRPNLEPQGHTLGTERFSAIPADLSKSELQTPTPQGRIMA